MADFRVGQRHQVAEANTNQAANRALQQGLINFEDFRRITDGNISPNDKNVANNLWNQWANTNMPQREVALELARAVNSQAGLESNYGFQPPPPQFQPQQVINNRGYQPAPAEAYQPVRHHHHRHEGNEVRNYRPSPPRPQTQHKPSDAERVVGGLIGAAFLAWAITR